MSNNDGSGEPAQLRRFTKAFAASIGKECDKRKIQVKCRPIALLESPAWAFLGFRAYVTSTKGWVIEIFFGKCQKKKTLQKCHMTKIKMYCFD